ncbi:pentapeptide repeat-containing protein [Desulfatibacillum aliphaticivorans]|uniref:pentapeptide repeat-containing protein n=1 Tax=Desulfatibacillum aliphaticivorans TaxID=218208 RepID=UPI0003F5324D|nr:pentapeptide repeat-containing protein [Desulfatibacillum aliphaticivorans]
MHWDDIKESDGRKIRTIRYEDGTTETYELRQISDEELQQVLAEHKKWVDSKHKEGKRADLRKTDLTGRDLSHVNLEWAYLQKALLENSNLSKAVLGYANLRKTVLSKVNFTEADLSSVDIEKAILPKAIMHRSSLRLSNFHKSNLRQVNLCGASIWGADLQKAFLWKANLQKANLRGANLRSADLRNANLQKTNLKDANLEEANVTDVKYDRNTPCKGIRVTSCYGSAMFKAFAQHQDFLEELQERRWNRKWLKFKIGKKKHDPIRGDYRETDLNQWGKALYYIWSIFADCGRTPWAWLAWSLLLAVYFGLNFFMMGPEALHISAHGDHNEIGLPFSPATMIYYSVVTFTTLGFGDVTPVTPWASWWVMAEVILGYIMLGGLISIFATLITRRS